ncbi:DUF4422 domain-containing protein [Cronobacter turicensis]|uniref:DUF4422 domain-containing protein n=1 Tax=Cronobacter turicensis TaxID=413502 RepID=UPI00141277AD|nr:DUF4422 domain-containing protein [Cronobacter turicensis]ELU8452914.1 DUF4422 domain-containing protein [Cronobacter turicensis]ELY4112529.1 DUF4422 domain-containing protein [Cronobacter turicensis]ELY4215793.1 DUF4422 domain-containing protein [Cronobacter turicensis]EMA1789834.1 DUF4422 domain-containing protein [Cronobacter turicensis]EMA1801403.1 DUF4422 domain-containing protein [Cronobacter turicensis]
MDIKIYSSYYKPYFIYKSDVIQPFFVGAAQKQNNLGIEGDNTGDNISDKNDTFNELTLIYWVWKNTRNQDYVGFCHYRRYFINRNMSKIEKALNLLVPSPRARQEKKLTGLLENFDKQASRELQDCDIALPKPIVMNRTLREQYADYHDVSHFDEMGKVIKEMRPEMLAAFEDASSRNTFFIANMFLFSRKYFDQFCEFAFPVLFELEKRLTIPDDPYQKRVFGYLGERLVTIFVNYLSRVEPIRVKYFDLLNTDIIFSNYKSYITEKKLISSRSKNYVTHGVVDNIIKMPNDFFSLNGWVIVKDRESYNYTTQVELYNKETSVLLNTERQDRPDVTRHFTAHEEKYVNYDGAGFFTSFRREELKDGAYKIKLHIFNKIDKTTAIFYVYDCYLKKSKKNVELVRLP